MIEKPLSAITTADVTAFLARRVPEGRTLDYKEELGNVAQRDPKKEFVADVCAFANASGGDLVIGVAEERDSTGGKTGLPGAANGIALGAAEDDVKRQLAAIIHDNTDPKLTSFELAAVPGFAAGHVLIVRVRRSPAGLHMSRLDGRFYRRLSGERIALDARGIREGFVESAETEHVARRFVVERLAAIETQRGATGGELDDPLPVVLEVEPDEALLVVHVIPTSVADRSQRIDFATFDARTSLPQASQQLHWTTRYNADGVACWPEYGSSDPARNQSSIYWQLFRTGAIEYVDAYQPNRLRETEARLSGDGLVKEIEGAVTGALRVATAMRVSFPVYVFVALLNVRNRKLVRERGDYGRGPRQVIDRRNIILPDVSILEANTDVGAQLRPTFDALWQAGGWKRSPES
ncbi:MAG: ATP-binding protein [Myxococcales bacterium]|nr:ATP-binding protein [Myxococcales bacterium]